MAEKENNQFIEIVNWKKAQRRMKPGPQDWFKCYTSLLEHEGFAGMDDTSKVLIFALWLYAARSGHHIIPADPNWLYQRVRFLDKVPDYGPLMTATDTYGHPNPFVLYCEPPKAKKARSPKSQGEENREEESRKEEKRVTNPTGSEEQIREKRKDEIGNEQDTTDTDRKKEAERPEDPKASEADSASQVRMPRPGRSAFNRRKGPQRLGSVLNEWLPEHWRDADCRDFGWEIIEALGMERNEHSIEIRSEHGSFAAFWLRIKNKASPMLLSELRAKAVDKAMFVNSPKCKSARNRSATWFDIMYKELNSHGINLPRKKRSG